MKKNVIIICMVVFKNWDRITKNIILIFNYRRPHDLEAALHAHCRFVHLLQEKSVFLFEYRTVAVQKRHSITVKLYTTAIAEKYKIQLRKIRLQNMQIER